MPPMGQMAAAGTPVAAVPIAAAVDPNTSLLAKVLEQQQQTHIQIQKESHEFMRQQQQATASLAIAASQNKLNPTEVSVYNGEGGAASYILWKRKWTIFEEKCRKCEKTNEDLYNMLMSRLKGTAFEVAKSQLPNEESYKKALVNLDAAFKDRKKFVKEIMGNLKHLPQMVDSESDLLIYHNKLVDILESFDSLNLSLEDLKYLFFISFCEDKISKNVFRIWLQEQEEARIEDPHNPLGGALTINRFLECILRARKEAADLASWKEARGKSSADSSAAGGGAHGRRESSSRRENSRSSRPHVGTMSYPNHATSTSAASATRHCPFCKYLGKRATHAKNKMLLCESLKTIKQSERGTDKLWDIVRKENIKCKLCLSMDHRSRECDGMDPASDPKAPRPLKACRKILKFGKHAGQPCEKYHCHFLHGQRPDLHNSEQTAASAHSSSRQPTHSSNGGNRGYSRGARPKESSSSSRPANWRSQTGDFNARGGRSSQYAEAPSQQLQQPPASAQSAVVQQPGGQPGQQQQHHHQQPSGAYPSGAGFYAGASGLPAYYNPSQRDYPPLPHQGGHAHQGGHPQQGGHGHGRQ